MLAYAIACLLAIAALAPIVSHGETIAVFVPLFPAVLLSTYLGGLGPGLVTVLLGGLGVWFFIIPKHLTFEVIAPYNVVALALYFSSAAVTCLTVHYLLRAADSISALAQQREILLIELQHRIKNHVQLISAILGVHARLSRNETVRQGLLDARARLNIVANAYSNLYAPGTTVPFHEHLQRLANTLRSGIAGRGVAINVEAIEASWGPDLVVPLSLIANELITNALEHGEPGSPIQVRLSRLADSRMSLAVASACNLPPDFSPVQSTGLGLRIVDMLAKQIKGELIVESAAGTFAVVFPEMNVPAQPRA